jgi:UDP-N-acetylmuramate--alanine ligase
MCGTGGLPAARPRIITLELIGGILTSDMRIYFAGIGGVGIGPLAAIAREAGYSVAGYDQAVSPMTEELSAKGVPISIGSGLPEITAAHHERPIDWLIATAALPADHPVLQFARDNHIRISKRDELINQLVKDKRQRLIAVSGTHGKTTTTAMITWLFDQFDIPESHSIGTRVSFAPSGSFSDEGQCFIYEADEYDRNMLQFRPEISLITSLDYDHPDIYRTVDDYKEAFRQFIAQSKRVYAWQQDLDYVGIKTAENKIIAVDDLLSQEETVKLPGAHNRRNALLACAVFDMLFPELGFEQIIAAISRFPGTQRRFERLAENLYSDYGHHPAEIAATLQMANEVSKRVVLVYQPHQNIRQHEMADEYRDSLSGARHTYWLPTYLTREDPQLPVLTPKQLIAKLDDPKIAEPAEMNDELIANIHREIARGSLVLVMGAGDIDKWTREHLGEIVDR